MSSRSPVTGPEERIAWSAEPSRSPSPVPTGHRSGAALSLSRTTIGSRVYYAAFVKDVTDEVKRREELYLLSLVANETDRAVLITDRHQRIVYCNRSFMEMFGYSHDELIGQNPSVLLAGQHTDPKTLKGLARLSQGDRSVTIELIGYDKPGRELWILCDGKPGLRRTRQAPQRGLRHLQHHRDAADTGPPAARARGRGPGR